MHSHKGFFPYISMVTTCDTLEKQHRRNRLCVNLSTLSLIFSLLLSYINYSIYKTITYYFFYTSGKMILFYWKYSNMTHITICNYFKLNYKLIMLCRDFTNLLMVTFVIWKQVLVNMAGDTLKSIMITCLMILPD